MPVPLPPHRRSRYLRSTPGQQFDQPVRPAGVQCSAGWAAGQRAGGQRQRERQHAGVQPGYRLSAGRNHICHEYDRYLGHHGQQDKPGAGLPIHHRGGWPGPGQLYCAGYQPRGWRRECSLQCGVGRHGWGRSIKVTTDGNINVTGNLTIEGITKAVTFPAKLHFKDGMDGTVEMNGTLVIDRTDWGIDYGSEKHFYQSGDAIMDEVKLLMKIVAKKVNR